MPYRRLPNTDASRIRALETALKKGGEVSDIHAIAYPFTLKQQVDMFLLRFKTAIENSKNARERQAKASKTLAGYTHKTRLYISHFIQVLNFTITRGELKPSARTFYGFDENDSKVPSLLTDLEVYTWGENIIRGEQERIKQQGGNPIYSPAISIVKVTYETFKEAYETQKQLQENSARFSNEVAQFRAKADALITNVWDEVEKFFSNVEDEEKRRSNCEEYGLTYIFRRSETEKLKAIKALNNKTRAKDNEMPELPFEE
ncbi:hypothetical protein FACS1894199_18960 [Bacteroidia bacterium]|nr:hypothetical protein FACS1894199_18960 [Bacteroidia bacterium]